MKCSKFALALGFLFLAVGSAEACHRSRSVIRERVTVRSNGCAVPAAAACPGAAVPAAPIPPKTPPKAAAPVAAPCAIAACVSTRTRSVTRIHLFGRLCN